ncbi:alpha/beta fold hydrolase [Streptomyces halstedii]|uniref:Alpha/beta fold hydrolase n=1 Tax=Streptomyces halstedii TaxID=1944 RepID=A0ABS6TXL1_STRHA|nr:alpha/beta fold hydrolase [Streptomyces halstedii]MBV7673005.1 alpha/beta fold hydrolase [Streptomyces halstedii]
MTRPSATDGAPETTSVRSSGPSSPSGPLRGRAPHVLNPWIRRWSGGGAARLRLICLPHAGGGASFYRPWAALLPGEVELLAVQYPGREDRFGDPLIDTMDELVTALADVLPPLLGRPYALFGHSMGSAVAWELAHELAARGAPPPRRLFVSGRAAPGTAVSGTTHRRGDEELCAALRRMGGTSADVLDDPELRSLVLGVVRNDFRLVETHRPAVRPPLDCPVHVLTGSEDPGTSQRPGRDRTAGWADLTTAPVEVRTFPGGHFYLTPRRREVVATVLRRMDPSLSTVGHARPGAR